MWTFATAWSDGSWTTSGRRFETIAEAAQAMMQWAITNADNGACLPVKLVKVDR